MVLELVAMELKVWVDGIQRVVCGVSEQTTCQEVVIALAQAIGEFLGDKETKLVGLWSSSIFLSKEGGVDPPLIALFFKPVDRGGT